MFCQLPFVSVCAIISAVAGVALGYSLAAFSLEQRIKRKQPATER